MDRPTERQPERPESTFQLQAYCALPRLVCGFANGPDGRQSQVHWAMLAPTGLGTGARTVRFRGFLFGVAR
jgi:hypothetical protein